ncbi:class III extradiol dioxygenase subunit B-like domain-containing protein [Pseudonocardia yunnanensis]|uniref:Catalytic LigB subunit of aromatic ring-opening dioxygenase n=1 Tax=Pseudonocardia yunnanensis TaxID=58107 RepID=A0ABW4F513_9PSEU
MLSLVAVVPEPPLLVPELATGAAAETAELRAACVGAAVCLGAASPRWIVVGADGRGRRTVRAPARGTFAGFGVDVTVQLDPASAAAPIDRELPLPLLIAGWMAAAAGVPASIRGELVAPDETPASCADLGTALAAEAAADPEPIGLLVVGDGAATHSETLPGLLDERAGPFDTAVATALRDADTDVLAHLDAGLATALLAAGRAPWQVLAAAAAGGRWRGELLHSSIPYGVAYHVAVWAPLR